MKKLLQTPVPALHPAILGGLACLLTNGITLLSLIANYGRLPGSGSVIVVLCSTLIMLLSAAYILRGALALHRHIQALTGQIATLQAELEAVRARRHTHAATAQLEDLSAVLDDLDREFSMHAKYIRARLKNGAQIIAAGRAGPHSYQSPTTENRPARPGVQVQPWKL